MQIDTVATNPLAMFVLAIIGSSWHPTGIYHFLASCMDRTGKKRLDSWKEIADYLKRDVTTVCRWEKEKGLPVHRLPGGARQAVFAYEEEIDSWLSGDKGQSSSSGVLHEVHPSLNRPNGSRAVPTHSTLPSDELRERQFSIIERSSQKPWKRTLIVLGTMVILTAVATIAGFKQKRVGAPADSQGRPVQAQSLPISKYDFEDGEQGWTPKPKTMISRVYSSDAHFYDGQRSLAIDFDGPYSRKSQVYVFRPPMAAGRTVTAYVLCPANTHLSDIALFVEDRKFIWTNNFQPITYLIPGGWTPLSVRVPADAKMPLARLGLEFTADARWRGTCFLDSVGW